MTNIYKIRLLIFYFEFSRELEIFFVAETFPPRVRNYKGEIIVRLIGWPYECEKGTSRATKETFSSFLQ